jgi:serine protease AprX
MKRIILKGLLYAVVLLIVFGLGSGATYFVMSRNADGQKIVNKEGNTAALQAYDDVRKFSGNFGQTKDVINMNLTNKVDIIPTLWFNQKTVWPVKGKMPQDCNPAEILENAKNPGLGVRELHKQGITGKGVNVAIIDQPLYQDHPEFTGKIVMYKDFDCKSESSMHGPAVASLLVGNTIGTAPGARLYYAAAPSWLADAGYYARAIDWIVEENMKLPANEKIRVVSVSAAPSGPGSPFTKNNDQWDKSVEKAKKEGILVLDCTQNNGMVFTCYLEKGSVEAPASYKPGFPGNTMGSVDQSRILVPTSPRTTAEEYTKGECSYQYTGRGGLSWGIPYCAGILAMGWEVNPGLSSDQMVELMFKSAYKTSENANIINPPEFIKLVKATIGK